MATKRLNSIHYVFLTLILVLNALAATTTSSEVFRTSFELPHPALNDTLPSFTTPDSPIPQESPDSDQQNPLYLNHLARRQSSNGCAQSYNSCANEGQQGADLCCPPTAACSVDSMGNVGCCPHGAACTGALAQQPPTATAITTSAAGGGAAGGAVGPQSTSAQVTAQGGPTVIISGGQTGPTQGGGGGAVFGAGASGGPGPEEVMKGALAGVVGVVGVLGWLSW